MDLRNRIIAPALSTDKNGGQIFDLDSCVKRILLFDTFILKTNHLSEIPYLIDVFTFDGLLELLDSNILRLDFFDPMMGSTNLPTKLFYYSFVNIGIPNSLEHVNSSVDKIIPKLGLHDRQIKKFRTAIYSSQELPQKGLSSFAVQSTKEELLSSPQLLADAVAIVLRKDFDIEVDPTRVKIEMEEEPEFGFKADSNIQSLFGLDSEKAHKIVESACLAIARRNERVDQMQMYSALSGFNDVDLPIFGEKLSFLASTVMPGIDEKRFQRIAELFHFPEIHDSDKIHIDAEKLLKAHQSRELVEFRHWLSTTDGISSDEIRHQVHNFKNAAGRFFNSLKGKTVRFLVTNGAGLIPPPIGFFTSIPLSVLDQFIIDKVFPYSGIAAFIDDIYPSIFDPMNNEKS